MPEISLSNSKILVTGATGFIGGRLVEILSMKHQAAITALVRDFSRTPRIACFPIKMISGDITDFAKVNRAMAGCELVFHCVYGNKGEDKERVKATVRGTENILKAALENKVKKVIYLSTVSVYGNTKDGIVDENTRKNKPKDVYGRSKLTAERFAISYSKKWEVPLVILQPSVVYGPYGDYWTIHQIRQMKNGMIILVDGGKGLSNPVYVDDVVNAMLLSAVKDIPLAETYIISGDEPVTWKEFYSKYEKMIQEKSTVDMTVGEASDFYTKFRKENSTLMRIVRAFRKDLTFRMFILGLPMVDRILHFMDKILPRASWIMIKTYFKHDHSNINDKIISEDQKKPIHVLDKSGLQFYNRKTAFSIEKAKKLLGYRPQFSLQKGMLLTEKWAKWANLL